MVTICIELDGLDNLDEDAFYTELGETDASFAMDVSLNTLEQQTTMNIGVDRMVCDLQAATPESYKVQTQEHAMPLSVNDD